MPNIQYDNNGMPIYRQSDGWKSYDEFQAAALNDMEDTAKKAGKPIMRPMDSQGNDIQSSIPLAGRITSDVLPTVGAAAGGLIPIAGETGVGELGGAAIGTAIKNYLRDKYPGTFGQNPNTTPQQVGDAITDIGLAGSGSIARGLATAASKLPLAGRAVANLLDQIPSSDIAKYLANRIMGASQLVIKNQYGKNASSGNAPQ